MVDIFYNKFRTELISNIGNGNPIHVAGGGRCDSPGYNAKYGTYTIIDTSSNKILDVSVIHVGTVANSSHMEKQGLISCIESIEGAGLKIESLTTNRHIQIRAYIKIKETT